MESVKIVERFKTPEPIFLTDGAILERWVGQMQEVGEACLYPAWRATIKLGGILYRKISSEDPDNADLSVMRDYASKRKSKLIEDKKAASGESSSGGSPSSSSSSFSLKQEDLEEKKKERQDAEKQKRKRERDDFEKLLKEDMEKLARLLEKDGEDEETIQEVLTATKQARIVEESKRKAERRQEREVIDLSKIDTSFSQSGIVSNVVQKALGLGEWEMEREFLEEKFFRFDKRERCSGNLCVPVLWG